MTETLPARNQRVQKVVLVNGGIDALKALETMLDGYRYDVVFVESDKGAYSRIKQSEPDLVVLCIGIEDARALQLLTMLRLDSQTCQLPVIVWVVGNEADSDDDSQSSDHDGGLLRLPHPFLIN